MMTGRNRNVSSTSSFITITQQSALTMSAQELNQTQDNLHRKLDRSISDPIGERPVSNVNLQQRNVNSSRYKTELCRPFEESGHCKYGDKCQFAHGAHELRTLNRHPKYKTELCRTFHTIGFCPYGPRCHFVHNEDETKMSDMAKSPENHQTSPPPTSVRRPSTISFCGSDIIPPPSSDSPSLSPASSDDFSRLSCSSSLSGNSSTSSSPVFNYSADLQTIASLLQPLNVQTQMNNVNNLNNISVDALSQQLHTILSLQRNTNNNNHNVFGEWESIPAPPSPPDSISGDSIGSASSVSSSGSFSSQNTYGSPLDISKQLRLPIFNTLSQDD